MNTQLKESYTDICSLSMSEQDQDVGPTLWGEEKNLTGYLF